MIGIIIAAGLGSRMRELTEDKPKCLLKINGKSLIEWNYQSLVQIGCENIYVITGYKQEKIVDLGYKTIFNKDFRQNNVLHSLMSAVNLFDHELIISYADIYLEKFIYEELFNIKKNIVISVDKDWQDYYNDRLGVPISQSENLSLDKYGNVFEIGKQVKVDKKKKYFEFTGIFKTSLEGSYLIKNTFLKLNKVLKKNDIFLHGKTWYKSDISDLLHYMIKNNITDVTPHIISKGWAEFDTKEDYLRLEKIKYSQKLKSIIS